MEVEQVQLLLVQDCWTAFYRNSVNGSNQCFSTITSAGGGGGGGGNTGSKLIGSGGSGGGGEQINAGFHGGTGNTPPVTPPQGNDGGDGFQMGGPAQVVAVVELVLLAVMLVLVHPTILQLQEQEWWSLTGIAPASITGPAPGRYFAGGGGGGAREVASSTNGSAGGAGGG